MNDALVKNAASKKQVKEASEKEKNKEERDRNDVYFVLNDKRGRRFYYKYLAMCRNAKLSYHIQDTHQTAFNEGMRNIGLKLLTDLEQSYPEAYSLMMIEAKGK